MKKLLIFTVLFLIVFMSSAQTREDTEEWIKYNIEENGGFSAVKSSEGTIIKRYRVEFTGQHLILFDFIFGPVMEFAVNISEIEYVHKDIKSQNVWIVLKCKNNNSVRYGFLESNNQLDKVRYTNKADIILEKYVEDTDIPERLIKALKHLVKLHGGEVKEEPF